MVISHLVRRRYDDGDDTHKKTFSVGQARSVHNQILFIRPTCHLGASHLLFRAGCLVYFDREQHNVQIIYIFFCGLSIYAFVTFYDIVNQAVFILYT